MDKTFELEILTPEEIIFKAEVVRIRVPGSEGYFGIMTGHAPFVTSLKPGELKVDLADGSAKYFATSSGIVEVLQKTTKILVETAEDAKEIDVNRAMNAKARAEKRLKEKALETDITRAKIAWEKACNRIRVFKKADHS